MELAADFQPFKRRQFGSFLIEAPERVALEDQGERDVEQIAGRAAKSGSKVILSKTDITGWTE